MIDSQSVKTTESGGPRGFDAGKKIKGRKRHIVTDTEGHLVGLSFTPPTFRTAMARRAFLLRSARAIRGCATSSPMVAMPETNCASALKRIGEWTIEIIKRSDTAQGFEVAAAQMGRRTYLRMARSLSQTGKGFRSDHRQRRRLGVRRPHPNPHAATRKSLKSNAIIMSRTLTNILSMQGRHQNQETSAIYLETAVRYGQAVCFPALGLFQPETPGTWE